MEHIPDGATLCQSVEVSTYDGQLIEEDNAIVLYDGSYAKKGDPNIITLDGDEYAHIHDINVVICDCGSYTLKDDAYKSELTGKYYLNDDDFVTSNDGYEAPESEFEEHDDYVLTADSEWYCVHDTGTCADSGEIHPMDELVCTYNGEYVCRRVLDESYIYVDYGHAECEYVYYEDTVYCADVNSHVHVDDATYCEYDDQYYYDTDEMPRSRVEIQSWHSGTEVIDLNLDKSIFSIGFEIEKDNFNGCDSEGEHVGEYEIFSHYETDGSCGVEAITNILPLAPKGEVRDEVYQMMKNAQWIINSETNERCGGHITVSCKDPRFSSSSDLYDRIKIPMAILYSLYRYRLRNEYCNSNKILNKDNDIENSRITSPLNRKTGCIEIRLPNRVRNIEQLQRRYELMYEIMQGALIENQNFGQIVDRCYPIIVQMYDGSKSKADRIVELAFMFRNFLATGEIHSEISEFI